MSTKNIRLKDLDGNILHPETDWELVKNKPEVTGDVKVESSNNAFELSDENGNTILEINSDGDLKTANFDSTNIDSNIKSKTISNNSFELSDENDNIIFQIDNEGNVKTKAFDSTKTGNVDDVQVNGVSVVTNKVANIEQPVSSEAVSDNALELSDENGNIIFRIDSNGVIQTKQFNSNSILDTHYTVDLGTITFSDKHANTTITDTQYNGLNGVDSAFVKFTVGTTVYLCLKDQKQTNRMVFFDERYTVSVEAPVNNVSIVYLQDLDHIIHNPMTSQGDLIIGNQYGLPSRLGKGTNGQVLKSTLSGIEWATPSYNDLDNKPVTSDSSNLALEISDSNGNNILEINSNGDLLTKNFDSSNLKTVAFTGNYNDLSNKPSAGMTNPMTNAGDLIIGGTSGTPARLAKGTTGQVLKSTANGVEWANESGGGDFTLLSSGSPAVGQYDASIANLSDYTWLRIGASIGSVQTWITMKNVSTSDPVIMGFQSYGEIYVFINPDNLTNTVRLLSDGPSGHMVAQYEIWGK